MKRPYIFNLIIIKSEQFISMICSVAFADNKFINSLYLQDAKKPPKPWESLKLLGGNEFKFRVIGLNASGEELYNRIFESDTFGNFDIRFPSSLNSQSIDRVNIYEVSTEQGVEFLMGSYIPVNIIGKNKLVISDFDKTLVDTKFSTAKELYISLSKPVTYFPKVQASIDILNEYISQGYWPFILSASPHFYEQSIRDWLYRHKIFTNNVFLKDYRKVFSIFEGDLTPKDLKKQGFYKLNNLVSLLLMTDIPQEIVLIGDGFESDTLIYLTLTSLMLDQMDPWQIWNRLKKEESFNLTTKQNFQFLSKFYQLAAKCKACEFKPRIEIFIRCREDNIDQVKNRAIPINFLAQHHDKVNFYIG